MPQRPSRRTVQSAVNATATRVGEHLAKKIKAVEAERDGAYHERAQLLALLASLHPSVIAPAPDVDEDGWQILYLQIGGKQASWHIAPRDAELYAHVEHVPVDDRRAHWDGHTTEAKYEHIDQHAARLYAEACDRAETPLSPYYSHEVCGFHWRGRDGLDIPTRDGQPICPRCELARVIALYEQWVKAGPPPLGASMARWWDARLVELHHAILPPTDQPKEQ